MAKTYSNGQVKEIFSGNKLFFSFVAVVLLLLILWLNPFVIIDVGFRGVVKNFGKPSDIILGEGLNFRIPIVQSVVELDIRVKKNETEANASSKDLQKINTVIALNYHLNPEKLHLLLQQVGEAYERNIIDPAVQEVVKQVTAQYEANHLITMRAEVSHLIKETLSKRLDKYFILVDDFSIKDFQFSKDYAEAIEAKQKAEQLAKKAEKELQRVEAEAKQTVTTAKAEAEALRLKNQSLSPMLLELRAIEKWDGKLPEYMGSGGVVPFVNIQKKK